MTTHAQVLWQCLLGINALEDWDKSEKTDCALSEVTQFEKRGRYRRQNVKKIKIYQKQELRREDCRVKDPVWLKASQGLEFSEITAWKERVITTDAWVKNASLLISQQSPIMILRDQVTCWNHTAYRLAQLELNSRFDSKAQALIFLYAALLVLIFIYVHNFFVCAHYLDLTWVIWYVWQDI